MASTAEPRVIDFTKVQTPDEQYQEILVALRNGAPPITHPLDVKGPTTFSIDKRGKWHANARPVTAARLKRARRILWQCEQRPEWAYRRDSFFRHPALMNVSVIVLRELVRESEARRA
jgi:hypothetical protein